MTTKTVKKPIKCAIYSRIATQDKSKVSRHDPISVQVTTCKQFAHEQGGWTVLQPYVDRCYSGATLDRPALKRLLKDAFMGKFDVILIEMTHRLSRSTLQFYDLIASFRTAGVHLISVADKCCLTHNSIERGK